jgi:hypothetical protein
MRTVLWPAAIFLVTGLTGPFIRWVVPVTPTHTEVGASLGDFVYNLVLLLWPAQALAVIEVNTGRLAAGIVAVGTNLVLFAVVGVVSGICARKPLALLSIYLVVCMMVVALAVWAFGRPFTSTEIGALACSVILYAIPFLTVFRLHRTSSPSSTASALS